MNRPAMLNRAFLKVFSGALLPKVDKGEDKDPRTRWALKTFWEGLAGGGEGGPAPAGASDGDVSAWYPSRYNSDFEELSRLGQGGFGQVCAALGPCTGCCLGGLHKSDGAC